MQWFMRLMIALVVTVGLLLPQASASDGGGDGGNDLGGSQQGKTVKKKPACEKLDSLKVKLDRAKQEAQDQRRFLRHDREDLADAEDGNGKSVKAARAAVAEQVKIYEESLQERDALQRQYDKLSRAC
jgi:hypothetical protein